jgi:hypothetical protein
LHLTGVNGYAGRQGTGADLRRQNAAHNLERTDAHAARQNLTMTRY